MAKSNQRPTTVCFRDGSDDFKRAMFFFAGIQFQLVRTVRAACGGDQRTGILRMRRVQYAVRSEMCGRERLAGNLNFRFAAATKAPSISSVLVVFTAFYFFIATFPFPNGCCCRRRCCCAADVGRNYLIILFVDERVLDEKKGNQRERVAINSACKWCLFCGTVLSWCLACRTDSSACTFRRRRPASAWTDAAAAEPLALD